MPNKSQAFKGYAFGESQYMRIDAQILPGRKTPVFLISEKTQLLELGEIKWHAPWRAFCFFPASECVFDSGCLSKIVEWVNAATEQYKAHRNVTYIGREPRVCPECASIIDFDPYAGRHICRRCGFGMQTGMMHHVKGCLSAFRDDEFKQQAAEVENNG